MMDSQLVIKKKIWKDKNYIALLLVDPDNYYKSIISVMKHLTTDRKMPGVYLTVNKPFSILHENFKKEGINPEMIIFIDAITPRERVNREEHEHCYYLESPDNLSDMSIAMSEALQAIQSKEKFIFVDSLSTLLVYNKIDIIIKFIHFIIGKMRELDVTGIILSLKKRGEASLIAELSQFCDLTIKA